MDEYKKGQLSKKKAATVMITLGAEQAALVYKYLRNEEVEQLTVEIAKLQKMRPDEVEGILSEFYELCLAQKVITEGGLEYAKNVLEKAFGQHTATQLIDRITKSLSTRSFEFLRKADPKYIIGVIQNEHPQTIALILSYASASQASAVLAELPREKQIDVVERISRMDRTSPEIIKEVEMLLESKFSSMISVDLSEIGGTNYTAEILNQVDRGTEKYILDELNKKDPKLAEDIRRLMFVFEDIVLLDSVAIQKFLREIDIKDLVVALKNANQEVKNVIMENLSSRMKETLTEEMQFLHNVRLRDVDEAQQKIMAVIRRLEEAGEIVISKGGKDEILV